MEKKHSFKNLLSIFLTFFKLGLFSIGGGTTMLTLLQDELVNKKNWLSNDELMEMTAISESTPGPIAVNLATYLGYKKGGFLGALLATLGVIITPFVLMFIISLFLQTILSIKTIQYIFSGIKVGAIFLLLKVSITLLKDTKGDLFGYIAFAISLVAMLLIAFFAIDFSAIYFILAGAILGILVYGVIPKKEGK